MAVITLTGENSYALRRALSGRVDAFVAREGDLALERLDGEEAEFGRIQEALTSLPFLASTKMVVLSSPSKNKQFAEQAEKLLTELPDTTDLVIYEPKFDKRSSLYKLLKKQADFQEFTAMDEASLARWLADEAKRQGANLSPADARYLVQRVGQNQQLLANELDKLAIYDEHITRQTIDLLTVPTPQSSIFELLDAALAGNVKRVLQLYDEQRAMKVEPQQIIAMFSWQLHILATVKTAGERSPDEIAREAKLSPFVVRKSLGLVRHLSRARLLEILTDLLDIDRRSKREAIDIDDALKLFILTLK